MVALRCAVAVLSDRVDIVNSTLGKALGGATGGYTTGPKARKFPAARSCAC